MKDFILNNYLIVIVVLSFLLFSLIGYLVDTSKNKKRKEMNREKDENFSYVEDADPGAGYTQEEVVLPEVSTNDESSEESPIVEEVLTDSESQKEFVISNKINDNIPEVENTVSETKES